MGSLLATLAEPTVARAQTAPPAVGSAAEVEPANAARQHFERGVQLVNRDNDPEAALVEFLESYRIYPTYVASLNVAVCLKELGRNASALEAYDALLARFGRELSAPERARIEAQRARLLERVGELVVQVDQPGTRVIVDGSRLGDSPLPAPLRLDAGAHVLRLSRDGFQVTEQQISIAPRRRKSVVVSLAPLRGVGELSVTTPDESALDVLIDDATVGRTPWQGNVAVGLHSVRLSGEGRGTAPISVDVRPRARAALSLRPVRLDTEISIAPEPASAAVYVDGVFVGNGGWSGALPAGAHRVEATAPGFLPFRRDLRLESGKPRRLRAALGSQPARGDGGLGLYFEPSFGLVLARTLRGSIDHACDCPGRSRPFGVLTGLRVGYLVYERVGIEVGAGYLWLAESSTRHLVVSAPSTGRAFQSDDFRDRITLSGPFVAVGLARRSTGAFPVTARLALGGALLSAQGESSGTVYGVVEGQGNVTGQLSFDEASHRLLSPFIASELRVGHYISKRLSVDLGVALALFVPPRVAREGRRAPTNGPDARSIDVLVLPDELVSRPFLTLLPSLAGRFDL